MYLYMKADEQVDFFHDLINFSNDMIFIIRIDDAYVEFVNQTVLDKLGYTLEEINELGIETIRRPFAENVSFLEHLDNLKAKEFATDYAYATRKDGSEFPVEVSAKYISQNDIDYNIAIVRDISQRVESEKRLQYLNQHLEKLVFERTGELEKNIALLSSYRHAIDESNIVSKSDLLGNITYVNDKFCEVTGYSKDEVIGKPHSIVRHPDNSGQLFKKLWDTIQAKKTWKGILKNRKKDGDYYWVDMTILPIVDARGKITEYLAIRHDITELIKQRESLHQILITDSLTGLHNRYKLIHDIKLLQDPSIALLNIDRFSQVNDLYGHEFGDMLIKHVSQTINKRIEQESTKKLYKLQSDEFAILNLSLKRENFIDKVNEIIQEISNKTYKIDNEEIVVQITAGISFEQDNLFATADMAMKNAKKKRSHLLVYDEKLDINLEYANNIKWTNKLRYAIQNDKLLPFYQAIVNNKTQKWEKYESLIRLIDEDDKVISPFFFLEIAKRTKYYETLTKIVIQKSFDIFKNSQREFSQIIP